MRVITSRVTYDYNESMYVRCVDMDARLCVQLKIYQVYCRNGVSGFGAIEAVTLMQDIRFQVIIILF